MNKKGAFYFSILFSLIIHAALFYFLNKSVKQQQEENILKTEAPNAVLDTIVIDENAYEEMVKSYQVVETEFNKLEELNKLDLEDFKSTLFKAERRQRVKKQTRVEGFGSNRSPYPMISEAVEKSQATVKDLVSDGSMSTGILEKPTDVKKDIDKLLQYGTMDALDDAIEIGPQTLLNTDEYIYASFYNRIRAEIAPRWEPKVKSILSRESNLSSKKYFKTNTTFFIAKDGYVKKAMVSKSSGVSSFDKAAVAAIYELPHVKNLPDSLLNEDGFYELKIQFGIHINNSNFQVKYFRPPSERPRLIR